MRSVTEATIADRIRASFARQSMMGSVGARLALIEPGYVAIEAPILDGYRQQQGFGHGGLVFTLADTAAGYAALTTVGPESEVMTLELKINYLAPAAGSLVAEGRVLRSGRRVIVVAADVWSVDEEGKRRQVAAAQGTMIPVDA